MRLRAVLPLAVAALLAGCGSGEPSASDRVTSTIRDYLRLQAEGDAAGACELLSPDGRSQLTAVVRAQARSAGAPAALTADLTCQRAIGLVRLVAGDALLGDLRDAKVERVTVTGTRATADVVGAGDVGRREVRLEQTGGDWRIVAVPGLTG